MSNSDPSTSAYSVSFRLQRTTTETAFVKVPVTADLMIEQPDGTGRIDVGRMVARALSSWDVARMSRAVGISTGSTPSDSDGTRWA